jgi:hypothetical protein
MIKVKGHTGCLLNEQADELAELGRQAEGPEIRPGPQKYGSFWLQIRPTTREFTENCNTTLPRDSAPNRSLFEAVAAFNALQAVLKRNTDFVTDLLRHKEGFTISKIIRRCEPAEYRVWLKYMTGIYPVQIYLQRIGVLVANSSLQFVHIAKRVPESLTHFACVCPKFREARTSAHNQVRVEIISFFTSTLVSFKIPLWKIFEDGENMVKT